MKWWDVIVGRNDDRGPDKPNPGSAFDVANNKLLKDIQQDLKKLDNKVDVILVKLRHFEDKDKQAVKMSLDLGKPADKP